MKARRDAQDISNQLGAPPPPSAPGTSAPTVDPASGIATVVAGIQQTNSDFVSERALYPAASRIESALANALNCANLASAFASQNAS